MQSIALGQDVASNIKYISSESGDFDDFDFIKCKLKGQDQECTVMFLAFQINQTGNESSS